MITEELPKIPDIQDLKRGRREAAEVFERYTGARDGGGSGRWGGMRYLCFVYSGA